MVQEISVEDIRPNPATSPGTNLMMPERLGKSIQEQGISADSYVNLRWKGMKLLLLNDVFVRLKSPV